MVRIKGRAGRREGAWVSVHEEQEPTLMMGAHRREERVESMARMGDRSPLSPSPLYVLTSDWNLGGQSR